jgi:hypothetical protein
MELVRKVNANLRRFEDIRRRMPLHLMETAIALSEIKPYIITFDDIEELELDEARVEGIVALAEEQLTMAEFIATKFGY